MTKLVLYIFMVLFTLHNINRIIFANNVNYNNNKINNHGILEEKGRIIAIGDLHADFPTTKKIFIKLNLINNKEEWIGGDTYVVQLGDQLDGKRGYNIEASGEVELLDFLERINTKAKKHGGAIHSLIGNHELMNLAGDFSYASKQDILDQTKYVNRRELFKPGGRIFGNFAGERHAILKIGNIVFSHAGIHDDIIDNDNFIERINILTEKILNGELDVYDSLVIKYLMGSKGILMNRMLSMKTIPEKNFKDSMEKIQASHQVIGHTVQDEINSIYEDKLWLIDVGISKAFKFNKNIQVLEILDNGINNEKNDYKAFRVIDVL
jgi:hypothetical protein